MITLSKKLKEKKTEGPVLIPKKRISIRDQLLIKEVSEMDANLPEGVTVDFTNPDCLFNFTITIAPIDGYWASGSFIFLVSIPEDYNIVPPIVKCETKLWHPNINEAGEICLSLLRQNSIDSLGWAPTRKLKDLIWGLNSLFSDLLNFDDPLNIEAAEHYLSDKVGFQSKVKDYIRKYCNIQK